MKQTHAKVTMPNTIQNPFWNTKLANYNAEWDADSASAIPAYTDATAKINFQINTVSHHMRLVIGGATTFKREGMTVPK